MCQKLKVRELIFVPQHARVSSRSTKKITTTRAAAVVVAARVALAGAAVNRNTDRYSYS